MERDVVATNGTRLRIDDFGDPSGTLILQLEGHMAQLIATPESYCRRLADEGFWVVRVDNRDAGGSQRFAGVDYTLTDLAEDVHGLVQVIGRPAVVCGRSMGGAVAQLLTVEHPEDVLGLGLFFTFAKHDPSPLPEPVRPAPFGDEESFVAWQQADLPGIAGSAHPFDPEFVDWHARTMWSRGVDWGGFERQRRAIALTPPWAHRLGDLSRDAAGELPVAIMHGAEDSIVPVDAAYRLLEHIPHAQLHIVPDLGHQQPAALDELFVAATLAAAGR